MSQILVGRVVQLVCELTLFAFRDFQAGMRRLPAKAPAAPEQPHHPITAPVSAAQQVAVKEIAPLHAIRLVTRRHDDLRQLRRKVRSDALVGVERKHPFVARGLNAGVALGRNSGSDAV